MSAAATAWALSQDIGDPTTKLVLIALGDGANEMHVSDAGQERVASVANISTRALRDHYKKLEGMGLIRREKRYEEGKRLPDLVILSVPEASSGRVGVPEARFRKEASGTDGSSPSDGSPSSPDTPNAPSLSSPTSSGPGVVVEGDLFGDGETRIAAAIGTFLERTGSKWRLKKSIGEWARQIGGEPQYAGVDIPRQLLRAAEWWESALASGKRKKPPKQPDQAIRNWLGNAAEDVSENGGNGAVPDWLEKETQRLDEFMSQ